MITMCNDRVKLTCLEERHTEKTRFWANDKTLQASILRSSYVNPEDQCAWFERLSTDATRIVFAIHNAYSGDHIGNTGFYEISSEHKKADFWILIGNEDSRGRGIGSAVMRLMLPYGFTAMHLNRIQLFVRHDNKPAIDLYEKFNFKKEGLLKDYCIVHDKYVDVYIMALLEIEYELQK